MDKLRCKKEAQKKAISACDMLGIMKQNSISALAIARTRLNQQQRERLVNTLSKKAGFSPNKTYKESTWWQSPSQGALSVSGTYQNRPARLKIQLVKPETSEITLIQAFEDKASTYGFRPPKMFATVPWDEALSCEGFIEELIQDPPLISVPATEDDIVHWFDTYKKYRLMCNENRWIDMPELSISQWIHHKYNAHLKTRNEHFATHPLVHPEDRDLIKKTIYHLDSIYRDTPWVFVHGHYSARDVFVSRDHIILTSNLYWGYRPPYYDAVFGYSWYMIEYVDRNPNSLPDELKQHMDLWESNIFLLAKTEQEKRLVQHALTERKLASLTLDCLMLSGTEPAHKTYMSYVCDALRKEL